jgi:hypothetical protein
VRPLNTAWKSTPGNFDPNHLGDCLWSDNEWGIPVIAGVSEPIEPAWSLTFDAFRSRVRRHSQLPPGNGVVTFFTADYRFEQCWTSPDRFLAYMDPVHWALTPDFSLYTDHPPAVHLWNLYRSRWLGAYWQRGGLRVIPTVSWALQDSYKYSFAGLPCRSVLAVSTIGVLKNSVTRERWICGFSAMASRLEPIQVLCCGALPKGFTTQVPIVALETFQARFAVPTRAGS